MEGGDDDETPEKDAGDANGEVKVADGDEMVKDEADVVDGLVEGTEYVHLYGT